MRLPGTALETSRLGLGCADLFRLPTRAERRRLLESAFDAGIRHFDVARMYGLGCAEREVGAFVKPHRGSAVVATKFGIGLTPAARVLGAVQGPARRVLEARPGLRQQLRESAPGPHAGRRGRLLYTSDGYDAAAARRSLQRSLKQLDTTAIDLFLLHDPAPGSVRGDEICAYLEEARAAGHLVAWGVAGEPDATVNVAEGLPKPPPVIQIRDDILRGSVHALPADLPSARITFGAIGGALGPIVRHVAGDPEVRRRWNDQVGADCGDPNVVAALLLRHAAHVNQAGVVLFSTVHIDRVRRAARALAADDPHDIDRFAALVGAELHRSS